MRVLQHFDTENFPLQRYIVEVERKMDPPAYLKIDTCYNLRPLGVDKKAKAIETKNFETVKILDKSTWPDRTYFGFDESQYEAFVAALTKQVAIIQGPPGKVLSSVYCIFNAITEILPHYHPKALAKPTWVFA